MFLGAMGGSTSGGMKIARIILLIKSAITETRDWNNDFKKLSCVYSELTDDILKNINIVDKKTIKA